MHHHNLAAHIKMVLIVGTRMMICMPNLLLMMLVMVMAMVNGDGDGDDNNGDDDDDCDLLGRTAHDHRPSTHCLKVTTEDAGHLRQGCIQLLAVQQAAPQGLQA